MSRRFTLLALGCSLLISPSAQAALSPCSKAIGGAIEKYGVGKRKAIAACEARRSKGSLDSSVNCRPADGAVTDAKTDGKLTKLAAKVDSTIARKCTGSLPPLGPACDSATTVPDLVACITAPAQDADVEPINVDTLMETVYDTNPPVPDDGLRTCQAGARQAAG